jgi:plasmid stabilization system protein ParE
MAEKYHVKWSAPAREDINEIIDYILQTNINYTVKILDKKGLQFLYFPVI